MSDFRTVTSIDPATPATGNYGHFSYPQPYDQIVGFHDLLVQLHKNDQIRDTRIPLPFSQIGIIRGLASEGVKAFPRQINVNGEMSKGAKLSKKEAMETFDIHYYRSQIFTPYIFDSYIDFSTSQGFVQERGAVTLEAFMVCSSYYRWLRQVHLSLFIKDLINKKQLVELYRDRQQEGFAEVQFNVADADYTESYKDSTGADVDKVIVKKVEIDFSTIDDTTTDLDIANLVKNALIKLFGIHQFRGQKPVFILPSTLWYRISDALRRVYEGSLVRTDLDELFLDNTLDRKENLYNVFLFHNAYFIGMPEVIVQDFSCNFNLNIASVTQTGLEDYDKPFKDDKSVVFFPRGVAMSEQVLDIIIGINRAKGMMNANNDMYINSREWGVNVINGSEYGVSGVNMDSTIKAMLMGGVAESFVYSDFANRNMLHLGSNPSRSYTQAEFSTRSDNKWIEHSSRYKTRLISCNDIIAPGGAITIKLPSGFARSAKNIITPSKPILKV